MLDTREVAALLREYGERTALRGGNPYRARAYRRAAENLVTLTEPLYRAITFRACRFTHTCRRQAPGPRPHTCSERASSPFPSSAPAA